MKHITAILLAGGRGSRFKSKIPKPLVKIDSRPIIIHSLDALSRHRYIKDIVVVANPQNLKGVAGQIKKFRIKKIKKIVLGGRRRQDSVANGLKNIASTTDLVLIHDAARPFIDKKIISRVIEKAQKQGVAIAAVPVKATIKKVKNLSVEKTIDRSTLWEVQTPQVFRKVLILEAYKRFGKQDVTDDAMLIEKLGVKVGVVLGSYKNIKITTPEDLVLAQAIAGHYHV